MRAIPAALASLTLATAGGMIALRVTDRALPGVAGPLRWIAAGVTGAWLATTGFHLLLPLHAFRLWIVLPLVVLAAVIALFLLRGTENATDPAGSDEAAEATDGSLSPVWVTGLMVTIGAALSAVAVRGLLLPVVAWDSMTYHATKAALWVQGGGPLELAAPGGWSIYRLYPSGGEILVSWAMLPFHGDTIAGVVDLLAWVGLGAAVWALGHECGLTRREALFSGAFVMMIPAASRAVGSLYVDNLLAALIVSAAALFAAALRRERSGALPFGFAALGLAVGTKTFALPVAAMSTVVVLFLIGRRLTLPRFRRATLLGLTAAAIVAAPTFVSAWLLTGYPLSPLPVEILGVTLGQANDAMDWYMNRPELVGAGIDRELGSLAQMFGFPGAAPWSEPTLGMFTLLPIGLGAIGFVSLFRRRPAVAALGAAIVLPLAFSLFGGGMRTTRLIWGVVSGRYVLAAVAVLVVVSFALWSGRRIATAYLLALTGCAGLLLGLSVVQGWQSFESIPAAGVGILLAAGAFQWSRGTRRWGRVDGLTTIVVLLFAMVALTYFRDQTRPFAFRESVSLHPSPRYFVDAIDHLDKRIEPTRIAVTSGPAQNADNVFYYPLLGTRLQHRIAYFTPTTSGAPADPRRPGDEHARGAYRAWRDRMSEAGITHVFSFSPASVELRWMEIRSPAFLRLAGDGEQWGLYEIRTPRAHDRQPGAP